jgi:AbrB family looped-hinge helix DNA binding protein
MPKVTKVGKRGTVVIPAAVRERYGLHDGVRLIVEEHPDGILLRRASLPITTEEREQFFRELDEQVAVTQRDDPAGWEAELAERRIYEGTLLDGLEDEADLRERGARY